MNNIPAKLTVKASQLPGILLEKYCYTSGSLVPLPKHSHHEYQLGLSFNRQGKYYYRGAYHPIPIGSLSIIHSGEVHSPNDITYLPEPASFWMMHVDPNLLEEILLEIAEKPASLPFFTEPVLRDRALIQLFYNLCVAIETHENDLEKDLPILDFFSRLIIQKAGLIPKFYPQVKPAIAIVCDFLQARYAENVSLAKLSQISGLSRFYLSRLFQREMGLSLSAYQLQVRIDRAKKLLLGGMPIVQVASTTGFYDRSHFSRYFKRLVGTTPKNYQKQQ